MKEKIIFMPHANIQYSQLRPERRYWVMKNCYERLFDVILKTGYKIAFEASGDTIEEIAGKAPETLEKLKYLLRNNQVEAVGSPYTHCMLSNIPPEVGLSSLKRGLDTWEKYTQVRPVTGWNPECAWSYYIPEIYKEAGFHLLIADGDSFLLSFDEIRKETQLFYDVLGHSNKNQLFKIEDYIKDKPEFIKYLTNPSVAPNGLHLMFRSDFMANPMLWYLMGATEGMREKPIKLSEIAEMLAGWKKQIAATGSFIMPYAEDAEYIGSSAYFYVKQFNQARFFEEEPKSIERFCDILEIAYNCEYEFATPSECLKEANTILPNEWISHIENGAAWHGGTAKAWANTKYSRIMDPVCLSIYNAITELRKQLGTENELLEKAEYYMENAWVSDSRWPPEPTSPGRFNVEESIRDMKLANQYIGECMEKANMGQLRSIYSSRLMDTQIRSIEKELMGLTYFGEAGK